MATIPRCTVSDVLDRVEIAGFKSLRGIDMELRRVSVLVGPNGAGKSNVIQAFALLGDMVRERLQVAVGRAGGASALLFAGDSPRSRIRMKMTFGANAYEVLLSTAAGDDLFFEHEEIWFSRPGYSKPWNLVLGSGHRETQLPAEARTRPSGAAQWALDTMRNWFVYHFHDTSSASPMKKKGPIGDNGRLRPNAENIAAFLYAMRRTHRSHYERIVETVRLVAPFFDDFELRPDPLNDQVIQLEWRQRGTDAYFNAHSLSDGTLRFICITTLLLQPSPPSLVLLDEPELGLHPYAIAHVAEMVRVSTCQVILSTQSVTLLNQMSIDDIVIAEQRDGATALTRPSTDELQSWLDDYGLGEIWEKNLIGGRPVQR